MSMMAKTSKRTPAAKATITEGRRAQSDVLTSLPRVGLGRWRDIAPFVGVSRDTWRNLIKEGKAPAGRRLSERCTLYDFSAVHTWIADPANFNAEVREAQ
jgi:prophage regulatory protein